MPPRIRSSKFSSLPRPTSGQSSSTRPQPITHNAQSSRQFSQTPCHQATLRRRKFYEWLNGPGKQLKEPLPESTNYLGAYDKYGNLVRAGPGYQRGAAKPQEPGEPSKLTETTKASAESTEETKTPDGQESLEELESAGRKEEAAQKGAQNDDSKLPPETAEDLRPFPLNQYFRSQPVLSEELREAIYQRVKRDGATVSLASVEFGVSNERVGAVVRLKQMEKEWVAQVRLCYLLTNFPYDMMRHYKIRLVFKTPTWLQNVNRSFASAERRQRLYSQRVFPFVDNSDSIPGENLGYAILQGNSRDATDDTARRHFKPREQGQATCRPRTHQRPDCTPCYTPATVGSGCGIQAIHA